MKGKEITVFDQSIHINQNDYFSLTDIAKYKIQRLLLMSLRIGLGVKIRSSSSACGSD